MNFLFVFALFFSSSVALSQEPSALMKFMSSVMSHNDGPMVLEAPVESECVKLEPIASKEELLNSPEKLIALFGTVLVLLKYLADALGVVALTGNSSAFVAARGISWLIALLGWLSGKMGWSTPRIEQIKTLPKWSDWKVQGGVKKP